MIDGLGTMYRCRLVDDSPKGAEAEVLEAFPGWGGHPYHLTVACCPTKNNDRFEWFVEKATEIGVDRIIPVIGDRSERKVYKTDRALRIALSATKQSLKSRIPEIAEPVSVKDFISGRFLSLSKDAHRPHRPGRRFLARGSPPRHRQRLHPRPPRLLPPPHRNRRGPGGRGGVSGLLINHFYYGLTIGAWSGCHST